MPHKLKASSDQEQRPKLIKNLIGRRRENKCAARASRTFTNAEKLQQCEIAKFTVWTQLEHIDVNL